MRARAGAAALGVVCGFALASMPAWAEGPRPAAMAGGLAVGATVLDLGPVPIGGPASGAIRVWNPGAQGRALRSRASCGCTVIGLERMWLAPGIELPLRFVILTEEFQPGRHARTIDLWAESAPREVVRVEVQLEAVAGLPSAEAWPRVVLPFTLKRWLANGEPVLAVDIGEPEEFQAERIPGSVNWPLGTLGALAESRDRAAAVVLCGHEFRGRVKAAAGVDAVTQATPRDRVTQAAEILARLGFRRVAVLAGGVEGWRMVVGRLVRSGSQKPVVEIAAKEARRALDAPDTTFLDVRHPAEFREGHVPAARVLNIPLAELRSRLNEIPKSGRVIVYCGGLECDAGHVAARILLGAGWLQDRVRVLAGGMDAWRAAAGGAPRAGGLVSAR